MLWKSRPCTCRNLPLFDKPAAFPKRLSLRSSKIATRSVSAGERMKNGWQHQRNMRLAGVPQPPLDAEAVSELAAGRDDEVGKIFRNMRAALKVPRDALARRLATSTAVIDSFEAGAIMALPHWKETERIVRSYCDLLRFDPDPVLWRLRSQFQLMANSSRAAPQPPSLPRTGAPRIGSRGEPSRAQPLG